MRTCSLACIRKHKSWSDCSGERDPTVYMPPKQLRTAAGIDHDYNFLHGLETTVQRTEKTLVEERGLLQADELRREPLTVREVRWKTGRDGRKRKVVVTRELREAQGGARRVERLLGNRLRALGVTVLCAPTGMQRQRENKTTFNRKTGRVNWQVEWLKLEDGGQTTRRTLGKTLEDEPLYKAYHATVAAEAQAKPAKGPQDAGKPIRGARLYSQFPHDSTWNTAPDLLQEPLTGRWVAAAAVLESGVWVSEKDEHQRGAFDYFLANPRQKSDEPRVVTKLEVDDCLGDVLRNTSVLEFPTIYLLRKGETLPAGFVLGRKARSGQSPSSKRKDGPGKKGPRSAKRRKQDSDLEEGEVGSDNDVDDKSSLGTGGNDEDEDGPSGGLVIGDVVAEESFDEDEEEDDDSPTSSSGTDSDDGDSD